MKSINQLHVFSLVLVLAISGCSRDYPSHTLAQGYTYVDLAGQDASLKHSLETAITSLADDNYPIENIRFHALAGGMTSAKLFTFDINRKKYVLRLLKAKDDLGDKQNEIKAHKYAADNGFAPALAYVDPELKFTVMDFIEGRMLTRADLHDKSVITSLGGLLARLHQYKGDFNKHRSQNDRARKHYERAVKKGVAMPSTLYKMYEEFIRQGRQSEEKDLVLCHGDLNASNIIVGNNGRLYLIDWPSATLDDRYSDLGYLTFLNGMSDPESKLFLQAYFGRHATLKEWKKFKQAQKRTSFLTAVIWFDFSESEQDKLTPMSERVQRLDELLKSGNLKTARDYIDNNEVVPVTSKQREAIRWYALGFFKTYVNCVD